jgi:carboxypeptidase PM20D1
MLWIILICVLLAALILTIAVRTLRFRPEEKAAYVRYAEHADLAGAEKLSAAIRVPTVSYLDDSLMDWTQFQRFQSLLEELFPLVHARCEKTVVSGYSLVYRLKSEQPNGKPVLITAHMDVVPVEEGTEEAWTEPPFSGTIQDGIVWGRGTLDTKAHLIGALEAVERLLEKDFSPARDIYLAFGQDEELSGQQGAKQIAAHFKNLGLDFDFVLDEGGCVANNVIAGIEKPIALVGVGEKGYANLRLSVSKDGGHSSMPARHTSLGILAQAICRIENHPFRTRLIAPTRAFLMRSAHILSGINRMILAIYGCFSPFSCASFPDRTSAARCSGRRPR